jgi:hypothetical protein
VVGLREQRRRLLVMYSTAIIVGALLGYLVLHGQPEQVKLTLLAGAGGVLLAAVTQVMISEAVEALHEEPPSLTGLMYLVGLAFFLVLESITVRPPLILATQIFERAGQAPARGERSCFRPTDGEHQHHLRLATTHGGDDGIGRAMRYLTCISDPGPSNKVDLV